MYSSYLFCARVELLELVQVLLREVELLERVLRALVLRLDVEQRAPRRRSPAPARSTFSVKRMPSFCSAATFLRRSSTSRACGSQTSASLSHTFSRSYSFSSSAERLVVRRARRRGPSPTARSRPRLLQLLRGQLGDLDELGAALAGFGDALDLASGGRRSASPSRGASRSSLEVRDRLRVAARRARAPSRTP